MNSNAFVEKLALSPTADPLKIIFLFPPHLADFNIFSIFGCQHFMMCLHTLIFLFISFALRSPFEYVVWYRSSSWQTITNCFCDHSFCLIFFSQTQITYTLGLHIVTSELLPVLCIFYNILFIFYFESFLLAYPQVHQYSLHLIVFILLKSFRSF